MVHDLRAGDTHMVRAAGIWSMTSELAAHMVRAGGTWSMTSELAAGMAVLLNAVLKMIEERM